MTPPAAPAAPPATEPRPGRGAWLALLLGLLVFTVLWRALLAIPGRWHGPDEGWYAAAAAFVARSGEPWLECLIPASDRPLHLAIYALADAVWGHYPERALTVLHSLVIGVGAWFLAGIAARVLELRSLAVAGGLAAFYAAETYPLYEGQTLNSEHPAAALLLGCVWLWLRGEARGSLLQRAAAFGLLGCAFLTKQQLAPLVLLSPLLWATAPAGAVAGRWRGFLREQGAAAGGFLLPLLTYYGLVGLRREAGVFGPFIFTYAANTGEEHSLSRVLWRLALHVGLVPVMSAGALTALATAGLWLGRRWRGAPTRELAPLLRLSGLFALSLLATLPGLRLYSHYFLLALPGGVLAAAGGAAWLLRGGRVGPRTLGAVFLAWSLLLVQPQRVALDRRDLRDDAAIGSWLRAQVPPERSILVWGFSPQLYLLSRRAPATRFVSIQILVIDVKGGTAPPWDPGFMRQFLGDLERDPPEVVVIPLDPNYAFDRTRYELERVPPFRDWLRANYAPAFEVHRHLIHRRLPR